MAAERKGKKLRRCTPRSAAYYKLQFGKSEDNKKKKLRRHIRNHPMDLQAIVRFEKDMGHAHTHGMTGQGKRRFIRHSVRMGAA